MGFGAADYLLYLDRKAIGAVEAKAEGTLTGVEAQSAKYAACLPPNLTSRPAKSQTRPAAQGSGTRLTGAARPRRYVGRSGYAI
jgi:hypothetical protein